MRTKHTLKTINPYFEDVANDIKKFEIRKNDRNYKIGDCLELREFIAPDTYTGRAIRADITYIVDNPEYCKDGYVVLGIEVYGRNF